MLAVTGRTSGGDERDGRMVRGSVTAPSRKAREGAHVARFLCQQTRELHLPAGERAHLPKGRGPHFTAAPSSTRLGFTSTRSTGIASSPARSPTLRLSRLVCLQISPSNQSFASHRCRRARTTD